MSRTWLICVTSIALAADAGLAAAHHSQAMFVDTPVWVTGTIVRYRPADPHVMIELQEAQPAGKPRKWIIEGPRRARLDAILKNNGGSGDQQILKVGDRIAVCGFALQKDFDPGHMYADWPPEQGRFVHGQLIVMPDGRMQSWGPYGALDNCVRRDDPANVWVAFLNSDALAHTQWCNAIRRTGSAHHTPGAFINDVGRGLDQPCP